MAHRLALVTLGATSVLILLGGLVTNTGAALAVPDWPSTFGYNMFLFPWARMAGGILYEHSHRLAGAVVGTAGRVAGASAAGAGAARRRGAASGAAAHATASAAAASDRLVRRPVPGDGSTPSSRRTRRSRDPPRAATASPTGNIRNSSIAASARAYITRSPLAAAATSSQQYSRSSRIRADAHHTAG